MTIKTFNEDIGLNVIGFLEDKFVIKLNIENRHLNTNGVVHGGVISTLLDTAMGAAFFESSNGEGKAGATLEIKINFFRPIFEGTLTAYGVVTNLTRRTAFVEGFVENNENILIAKASATMMISGNET